MRSNRQARWLLRILCGVILSLSFLSISTIQAHAVTPQIDSAPYTPYVTYVDIGAKRYYTIHNLLLNDDPYILTTGYGKESFESLYERNVLAFDKNVDVMVAAIKGQDTSTYNKHTGWYASVEVNGSIIASDSTENGYIGETYTIRDVSEAYNKYKNTFPSELVDKIATKSQYAEIFEVVNDSRDKRDAKYHLWGGRKFTATSNGTYYSSGDEVFVQYKDNYVYVDVDVDVDIPSGGGGGGGTTPEPCTDCGGSGGYTPPCTNCGGGGSSSSVTEDKVCHSSADGYYPNCYPRPFNLTGEIKKQVYPTWGTGEISWGLFKSTKSVNGGSATLMASNNLLPIGSGHYEALTPSYSQSGVMSGSSGRTSDKTVTASDKGTQQYSVNYDYTNHYIETYKCTTPSQSSVTQTVTTTTTTTDEDGNETSEETSEDYTVTAYDYTTCYSPLSDSSSYWQYVSERADWSKGETYSCSQSLAVDHNYGATLSGTNGASGTYNIGRHANVQAYANSCSVSSTQVFTETISHASEHKELNTQTYIEFVKNPVKWQGNPNYDTTTVMPFVADTTSQGNMGVPELDEVFKKNNKYTTQFSGFTYPYNIPMRKEVSGTDMKVLSQDDFWVSRSTGFVYSVPAPSTPSSALNEVKTKFKNYTGQEYRDSILNTPHLTSVYYLPIDANNNVMKPNTTYNLEMQLRNLGYNNITLQHKQTFSFKHYLLGSVFEEKNPNVTVKIVEQNEIPIDDIKYPYSSTLTVEQGKQYSDVTKGRTNFIFGHKATDSMAVYDKAKAIIGIDFSEKVDNPLPHVIDRESANATLYTEWD